MADEQLLREVLSSPLDDLPPLRPVASIAGLAALAVLVLLGGVLIFWPTSGADEAAEITTAVDRQQPAGTSGGGTDDPATTTTAVSEVVFPPSSRFSETVALGDGTVVAFGGFIPLADGTAPVEGTWLFDVLDGTWTRLDPDPTPAPRFGHALALHPPTGRIVLFGGGTTQPRPCPRTRFCTGPEDNQVWHFDPEAGTWEDMTPPVPDEATWPATRFGARLAYEPVSERFVMFGGVGVFGEQFLPTFYDDTWFYDPVSNEWEPAATGEGEGPIGRTVHGMVWNAEAERVMMFGGDSLSGTDDDHLWAFDPATGIWEDRGASETGPYERWFHLTTADPASGRLLMIGGIGSIYTPIRGGTLRDVGPLDEVWSWSEADGWVAANPAPTPLGRVSGAADAATLTVVLDVGGDILGYDPAIDAWSTLAERPEEDEE